MTECSKLYLTAQNASQGHCPPKGPFSDLGNMGACQNFRLKNEIFVDFSPKLLLGIPNPESV